MIILLFISLTINAGLAFVLFFVWSDVTSDDDEDAHDDLVDDDDYDGFDREPHHAWG